MTTTAGPTAVRGPAPVRTDRWQPTRAGLVSVWRYVEETFHFHQGRLLLRGANGSGKSMALELLLPFLLDADTNPHRLTSAAKSRGGLFDRIMTGTDHPSRTGFVWVEFGRGDAVFTVGARMRASRSTRRVDVDYFTSTARVGDGLELLDEHRVPLSLKGLKGALAESGRVYGTADEYRTAVREALYEGFGPDRYASVITALLALRKEKLSQNLDLDKLSEVMSEALPPLDDHDIAAVAEGFERLDRRREQLETLRGDLKEVDLLATRQRAYARQVIAWLADEVRAAESRRDTVTRTAREAAERLAGEQQHAQEIAEHDRMLDQRIRHTRAEIAGFRDSDAFREGSRLIELHGQIDQRRTDVEASERALDGANSRHHDAEEAVAFASEQLATAAANLDHARRQLDLAASSANAGSVVAEAAATVEGSADADAGERLVSAHLTARRQAIGEVRVALRAHDQAIQQRDAHADALADTITALDAATEVTRHARAQLDRAGDAFAAEVNRWARSCRQLPADRALAALPDDLSDPGGVAAALAQLRDELHGEHERLASGLRHDQGRLDATLRDLESERDRFAAGSLVEPVPPPWRADRSDQPGTALWRTVDIDAAADTSDLDGVEAALTAAGLIDAWIRPDGVVDLSRADVTLVADPLPGPTLRSVLVPLAGAGLDPDLVDRVLRSISVVDTVDDDATTGVAGTVEIGRDGTFRVGVAIGRGRVRPIELLGAAARERRRLERLSELDSLIGANREDHRELGERLDTATRRWNAVTAELGTAPDGRDVAAAERDLVGAEAGEEQARHQHTRARGRLDSAERAVREALRRLTLEASRHHVPADPAGLDDLARALDTLDRSTTTWARRWRDRHAATAKIERERREVVAAADAAAAARESVDRHRRALADLISRVTAIEEALGSKYEAVVERIGTLERRLELDDAARDELRSELPKLERLIGSLEQQVEQAEIERAHADTRRSEAHGRFVTAVHRGMASDAGLDPPAALDGVTAVLTAARDVATRAGIGDTGGPPRDRASARVEEQLHVARQRLVGSDIERTPNDDGWTDLTALVGGQRRRIGDLAAALRTSLDIATAELHDDEEQLFSRVLAGDIRRTLAARIRHANELVDSINRQLDQVRTKVAGVQARLTWNVDDEQPDAVRSARALLLRDPSGLTDTETAALQAFVRARVEQARADLEANAPWEARLRETLDYRRWHRFTLQIAHRDWDGYQPVTPRRLQKLSTGERSIALHLPMLASMAAHYTAADGRPATCPRLILLDELFASVDPTNRSQLFARFTDWDLDAVFTSDHEWCQYATLDGIAIHHLHPAVADEPVTSTRFTWDGQHRTIYPADS
jgi:uncharacterized protein (TIGR02680 family)